jgi:hypothetical protein
MLQIFDLLLIEEAPAGRLCSDRGSVTEGKWGISSGLPAIRSSISGVHMRTFGADGGAVAARYRRAAMPRSMSSCRSNLPPLRKSRIRHPRSSYSRRRETALIHCDTQKQPATIIDGHTSVSSQKQLKDAETAAIAHGQDQKGYGFTGPAMGRLRLCCRRP